MRRSAQLTGLVLVSIGVCGSPGWAANTNGAGGEMSAYYDGNLFTIRVKTPPCGTTTR